ncbi:Myb-like protein J [Phytophthora citrophthora]|uniref:Myb-like protein J n=1 Tax=Phytophthora citrophthora TaxID=4793 RepID=A0AAD9G4L6_9STRA|nr:Myb-like protein J [Phytophthora citrophthora]
MPENQKPTRIILSTLKVKVMPMERGYPRSIGTSGETALKQRHRFGKWLKTSFQWCVKALTLRCLWKKPTTFTEAIATSTQGPAMQSKPIISRNNQRSSASIEFPVIQVPEKSLDDEFNMRSARLAARESEWCGAKRLLTPTRDLVKKSGIWSSDEHERYCEALEMYRYGSWKQIAAYVGTRTERQVLSHAQSIRARKEKKQPRTAGKSQEMWRNLFTETRKSTPEELLAASMADTSPPKSLLGLGRPSDVNFSTDTITDFPSMDLSFELNIEDFDVVEANEEPKTDAWEEFTRNKRSRPNSDVSIAFDGLLTSSSMEMLLDGILSDDDLHEILEIPSTQSEIQSTM